MEATGAIVVAIRWLHLLASVALLGSLFFSLAFLGSESRAEATTRLRKSLDARFRELVDACFVVFLLTGALLTFERLSGGRAGLVYVGLLGLKVALALLLFHLLYRARRFGLASSPGRLRVPLTLGAVILLLAVALKALYDAGA